MRLLSYYFETTNTTTFYNDDGGGGDDDDDDDDDSSSRQMVNTVHLVGFGLLAVSFWLLSYATVRVTWSRTEFRQSNSAVHVMLPAVSAFMGLECCLVFVSNALTMTTTTTMTTTMTTTTTMVVLSHSVAVILYMLEALVAPGIFLSTFAVTFLAYRIRGMPFCFVRRRHHDILLHGMGDVEGTPYKNADSTVDAYAGAEPLVQPRVLVLGMRVVAALLTVVSVLVDLDVVFESGSDLAGRTGWASVFSGATGGDGMATFHVVIALMPMTLVCLVCVYFAMLLWRYGNELSMTIYTSFCNPWMTPLLGALAMLTGQMFGPKVFPLMSNLGIFLYLLSIWQVLLEVRRDLEQAVDDLGGFLGAVWGEPMLTNKKNSLSKSAFAAMGNATVSNPRLHDESDDNETTKSTTSDASANRHHPPSMSTGFL